MTLKIAIIDYEMGNLNSISKLLNHLNAISVITSDPDIIFSSDGVILPGVGAFGDAMKHLGEKGLISVINQVIKDKMPLLAICLGLQLLFSESQEYGVSKGLNFISGTVSKFDKKYVKKIPQIGWNSVEFKDLNHYLIQNISNNSYFYFNHSFYANPSNNSNILATTRYGNIEFASMVFKDSIVATQFHPEKSGKNGISIYKNFLKNCRK